ncbi:uncharacterized protein NFIA_010250 [Aspergillus fischeri NRRL 181]|uniref:Uncharacterized protein n=1 Tax=Neosartorya fischeri (strain ATCC 1020 / DSM 3700 / CBS 544.65 / FGSC A1164 / JCM 1740 / NRRL 181 / WB 181) TaxID=331117 RepID=A1D1Q1_NEOFI|nr:conserved hypothetical protein [Aspergillus fischeri NRRL 181]EAW22344.1 conserved hypothetical protein [Aspergillus fischeri NRRL 181]KAG2012460.1 hypothetical protein GB937_007054 [Aspergillus fischeri]
MSSSRYQELWVSQEPVQPATRETDTVRSVWQFPAAMASTLSLLGYLMIPLTLEKPENNPQINKTVLTIAAMVLIGVAYALSFVIVCAQIDQRAYLLHSVFLYVWSREVYQRSRLQTNQTPSPCLSSSLFGLFNLVFNILCRNILPMNNLATIVVSLCCAFVFLYALGALWIYGRTVADETRIQYGSASPILLTEEEMQRQQLLRLLQQNGKKKRSSAKAVQKTFKVDVPEVVSPGKGWDRYMPPREEYFI